MVIKCTDKGKMLAVLSKLELETNCMWRDGKKPTGCVPDSDTFPIWLLIDEAPRITWSENDYVDPYVEKDALTDDEYLALDLTLSPKNKDAKIVSNDPVNHPSHYTQGKVECIDAMEQIFGRDAVISFSILNSWKYLWRRKDKGNESQDIQKAIRYFDIAKELINR